MHFLEQNISIFNKCNSKTYFEKKETIYRMNEYFYFELIGKIFYLRYILILRFFLSLHFWG